MYKITSTISVIFILWVGLFMPSCKHEDSNESGQIKFIFASSTIESILKSSNDSIKITDLAWVVYTLEDASGNVIKNAEKVELHNYSNYGHYSSELISLRKGSYKLTGFLMLDWRNKILYASPVKGSSKASLVQNPLPMSFEVSNDKVTELVPEVLSAYGSNPDDFGYITFGFDVANTFDFLIGVFIQNDTVNNYELTSATIEIKSDPTTDIYYGPLNGKQNDTLGIVSAYDSIGVTNKVTLPERYKNYTLVISKPGYNTYTHTFTKETLKLYLRSIDKGPLVVILDKSTPTDGLVAYYKFNGDVLDYSGNNNHGTYLGRGVYSTGYESDVNGAIDLNGSSDYVFVNNSASLSPTSQITISAWYYSVPFYGNGANTIACKENILSPPASIYHLAVQGNLYLNDPVFLFNVTTDEGVKPISTSGYFNYSLYQWYFVTGVYDGNYIQLYVDGNLITSVAHQGKIINGTNNIVIGNTEGLSRPDYDFTAGKIDEVRIYNRALSQEEIVSLYLQKATTAITDFDGNVYHTITIGTQVWMLENLKTTHFNNGDPITHTEDGPTWTNSTTPAYCEYGDPSVYGRLYNWYTTADSRGICPKGYHIPSQAECQILVDYLGGNSVAGGKLKEAGLSHWTSPNTGASNSSGFTALPEGYRHGGSGDPYYDYKANLGWSAYWWTSTQNSTNSRAYTWGMQYTSLAMNNDTTYKANGLGVRCIKNN